MLRTVTVSRGGLALLLLLLTIAVFAQVRSHDFVDYDDYRYVVENPSLALGFGREALARIWLDPYLAWIPLTSLSLQLSHALHGLWAGGYLLGNLALHAAATLVLFFALARMTRRVGRSAFVAAIFAVHPLNVESVAWVSGRKDVLSGLFFMLTLAAYPLLAERPRSIVRQAAVALCFALGLLAKPMLVTLPCVLLLLDFWPLGRLREPASERLLAPRRLRACALEKLPLLCLVAASAGVTYAVQERGGAMLFAAAFMAYSGLVLSSWNSIAFWNTPLLPILYIAYSFLAGLAALPLVVLATHGGEKLGEGGSILWPSLLLLLALNGFLLLIYIWGMATATAAARESVRRLVSGAHRWSFWIGVVGVGLVLPFAMIGLATGQELANNPASALWLATACGAIQVGGFLLRDSFLRVGVYGYPV